MMLVSVVLPCRNEEGGLPHCIERIRGAMARMSVGDEDYEIVVSDSSTDNSPDIAEKMGARVMDHRKGYGDALLTGLDAANGRYLVFADCDCSYDFQELPKFIEGLDEGYDLVIGSRFKGKIEKSSMPLLHRYIGNPLFTSLFNKRFQTDFSDVHSGYRGVTKEAYTRMGLKRRGMEFALEMLAEASCAGLKVKEVPIHYSRRKGESKLNTFRDGLHHLIFILKPR